MMQLETEVLDKLQHGGCADAIQRIQSESDLQTEPRWYFLLADAQADCFRRTKALTYKTATLVTLDSAVRRFPQSSRVFQWQGFFAELVGEQQLAVDSYKRARELAESNIRANPGTSYDDQAVLKELNQSHK